MGRLSYKLKVNTKNRDNQTFYSKKFEKECMVNIKISFAFKDAIA